MSESTFYWKLDVLEISHRLYHQNFGNNTLLRGRYKSSVKKETARSLGGVGWSHKTTLKRDLVKSGLIRYAKETLQVVKLTPLG